MPEPLYRTLPLNPFAPPLPLALITFCSPTSTQPPPPHSTEKFDAFCYKNGKLVDVVRVVCTMLLYCTVIWTALVLCDVLLYCVMYCMTLHCMYGTLYLL